MNKWLIIDQQLAIYERMVLAIANRLARPDLDCALLAAEDLAQELRIILWHELNSGLLPEDDEHRKRLLYLRLRDRGRNYVRACSPPASEKEVEAKRISRLVASYPELLQEDE